MRIVLATSGSRGDVQPMIALSLGLINAGHDVRLVGPPEKKQWAEALGCPYTGLGQDVTAFLNTIENPISLSTGLTFVNYVRNEIHTQFEKLPQLIENANLVIGSSLMFALSSVSESLKIKYRYVAFTPQLFPSSYHPFIAIKTQTLPKWCNALTWKLAKFGDKFNSTFIVNQHRKKMGLPLLKDAWQHIFGTKTIVASDPQIACIPKDVVQSAMQTGYLHLKISDVSNPGLDSFLEKDSPPIFAGFGSMPPKDQAKHIPLLIHVARQLNKRIIISKFWKGNTDIEPSKDIFFIKDYPHEYLFPKMAAIIHHGGAGTTATAALSGKPQVIVPHILDQYYHGYKVFKSGFGSAPIMRSKLTAKRMIDALSFCFSNPDIQQKAKQIAQSIHPESSLHKAIRTIEETI
jgi:UDP:flavonoid glycosyltransferase YjiC (YdhE family)